MGKFGDAFRHVSVRKPKVKSKSLINEPEEKACMGLLSVDSKEMIINFGFALIELFKVIMASLLSLLVPTLCKNNPNDDGHLCTTNEIIWDPQGTINGRAFSIVVIVFNFLTLFVACCHYCVIFYREKVMIKYLDDVTAVPDDRLKLLLPVYPEIRKALQVVHYRSIISSVLFLVFFIVNIVLSGLLVINLRYYGVQTVTVFVTNIVLLLTILHRSISQSWDGLKEDVALSLFTFQPQVYNSIDRDYVDGRDKTDGGRIFLVRLSPYFPHVI